jgi:membrane fusion protein, heavy metal efflux system
MKLNIILAGFVIMLITACDRNEKDSADATEKAVLASQESDMVELSVQQMKNSGIAIAMPEQKQMHASLKVSGVVDVPPQNIVSISIPLGGYLKKMTLIPGQRVSKGSLLATLEDQQYIQLQQDYLTAKNRLHFLETDYARQKGLNETKATSDKVYQQSLNDFNGEKILVKSLAEKLRLIGIAPEKLDENNISRNISIYSPINGYVTQVNANPGKYINPADILVELVNPDDLHVKLTVLENHASNLVKGQKIICTTSSHPEVKYAATIEYITPSIQEDRTTEVHCHLAKHGTGLFPGTYLNAVIEVNNARVTAVPEEAVVKWENKFYLFSAKDGNKFKMVPVEIGTSSDGFTEIKSDLPMQNIVIKNAYTILMKMKNAGEEG